MEDRSTANERTLPVIDGLDTLTNLLEVRPRLYLRCSHGPVHDGRNGPTRDGATGVVLPGLTVITVTPEPWWPRPARDWVARQLSRHNVADERHGLRPWLLSGRLVGHGPDGQPVVANVVPVAWIDQATVEQARRHYRAIMHDVVEAETVVPH